VPLIGRFLSFFKPPLVSIPSFFRIHEWSVEHVERLEEPVKILSTVLPYCRGDFPEVAASTRGSCRTRGGPVWVNRFGHRLEIETRVRRQADRSSVNRSISQADPKEFARSSGHRCHCAPVFPRFPFIAVGLSSARGKNAQWPMAKKSLLPRSISGESLLGLSLRVSPMPGRSIRREKPRDARGRSPEMICRQLLSPLSPPSPLHLLHRAA